ncbi:MAG: T9SS type A sorting domain-containing protein [Bacteroidetes bacterium]|nr:T9SS type A sorting domain-containing protein [Bacteroidota bacterium]
MKKLITRAAILISTFCAFTFNAKANIDTVQVANFSFTPNSLTLCLGDTIRFVWASGTHNVHILTPIDSTSNNLTGAGDTYDFTPTSAVTYTYECGIHGSMMSGTFTVNVPPSVDLGADVTQCVSALLDAGNPGSTYLWSDASTSQTLTVSSSGTYSVIATNMCGADTDTVMVTINPGVVINLGPDTITCAASVVLDAMNAGPTYLWSTGESTQTISITASGAYYVDVTDGNGCMGSDTILATFNTSPVVNLGADVTQCGGNVLLDAGNPGDTYLWSDASTDQTLTVSASGTYSVVVTNSCGTSSDTVDVTINTLPTVSIADVTQCGGTVLLDAGNPGDTYLWSDASTDQTLTVSVSGNYSVVVTNPATGCAGSDGAVITINTPPVVSLGADATVCGSTMLDAGNPGSTYLWSDASTNQTLTISAPGTYSVLVTDVNGCTGSDTVIVTINALPVIVAGSSVTICSGSSTTLTGSGGITYAWVPGGQTTASIVVSPPSTTSYTVTGTDANGCSNTAVVAVTVNNGPVVTTSSTPSACGQNDGTATANPSGGTPPYVYVWISGQTTQTVTGLAAGSYTVCVTDAGGCQSCSQAAVTTSGSSSLQTTFAAGNAQNGNMFDVTAINNLIITGIDGHPQANTDYEIYYKTGTHVGFETTAGAWTLAGSVTGVVAQVSPTPTPIPIALNINVPAGQTYALYATCTSAGISQNYTNGTAVGNIYVQDANIQIKEGKGVAYPFGSNFQPRIWNGIIHYCSGPVGTQDNLITLERGVNVYPNPFTSTATVVVAGADIHNGADFMLFDLFGREIKKMKIETNTFDLSRNNTPAGVYFYRVNDSEGTVGTGKIVIE